MKLILLFCFFCLKNNILAGANKGSQNVQLVIGTIGGPTTTTTTPSPVQPVTTPTPTVVVGGCGTMRVKPNSVLQIQSNNFPYNYYNRDACEWKFVGTDCTLTATCPCFDIPSSFNCLGDHLRISDGSHYTQKFCGENKPFGKYRSGSDNLSIRFKANSRQTASGFLCYITCTPAGVADQQTPDQRSSSSVLCLPPPPST